MPIDKELEFRKLRIGIKKAVLNRQQGSWSRALWYGGQSLPARGAAWVTGKATSAPAVVVGQVIKVAAAPVLTPIGVAAAGFLASEIAKATVPRVIDQAKKLSHWLRGLDAGLDATPSFLEDFNKLKEEAIPRIDRNVSKLDDAVRNANKLAQTLEQSARKPAHTINLDDLATQSEAALRAVYEVGHYHGKLVGLVSTLAAAVQKLSEELEKLNGPSLQQTEWVEETAKEVLGHCRATAEHHEGKGPRVPPPLPPRRGGLA